MKTKMTGPTYFAPLIERFMQICREEIKVYPQLYFIFVILTDGCLHDMEKTKEKLIEMSYLPISVIIVGIGDEDFSNMEVLDADHDELKDAEGNTAVRDVV